MSQTILLSSTQFQNLQTLEVTGTQSNYCCPLISRIIEIAACIFVTFATLGLVLISDSFRSRFWILLTNSNTQEKKPQSDSSDVLAAKNILTKCKFDGTSVHTTRYGYSLYQIQGTPNSRKHTHAVTQMNPQVLNPSVLREAKEAHLENYLTVFLKRIGHALHIEKDIILPVSGKKCAYYGFNETFTIPMIADSLKKYHEWSSTPKEESDWMMKTLMSMHTNDNYQTDDEKALLAKIKDKNHRDPILIAAGYDWHLIPFIFFRGFLIVCNRGADAYGSYGINLYCINNLPGITEEDLRILIRRCYVDHSGYLSETKLNKKWTLMLIYKNIQKSLGGNFCTYGNSKSLVKVLMAIRYLMNDPTTKNRVGIHDWDPAFIKIGKTYKRWNQFDKRLVIEDAVKDVDQVDISGNPKMQDFYINLFKDIYSKINGKDYYPQETIDKVLQASLR